jgi:hypothetical protein
VKQNMYGCWNLLKKVKYNSKDKVSFLHKLNFTFNLFYIFVKIIPLQNRVAHGS